MHETTAPTRIALAGGPTIDVDPAGDHLEVTLTCAGRARAGIALSRAEAAQLISALLDATAPRFGVDDVEDIEAHCSQARRTQVLIDQDEAPATCSPAQYVATQRQARNVEAVA